MITFYPNLVILICLYSFQNGTLRTCVLRFGGIYGPGESAMQDRIVNSVNRGAFGMFSVIRPEVEIDYLHVNNANQALR